MPQKGNKGEWHDKSVINVDVQKIVAEVAAAAGVTLLVDFFGALGGIEPDPDLYHDKIHPNDRGYEVLGREALAVVAEWEERRAATSGPTPRPSTDPTREPTVDARIPDATPPRRDLSTLSSEPCVPWKKKRRRPLVNIRSKPLPQRKGSSRAPRRLRRRVAPEQRPPLPRDRRPRRVPAPRPVVLVVRRPAAIEPVVGF